MKYLVLVRYMWKSDQVWKTIQREFNDLEAAQEYANGMYASTVDEITVLIYQLIQSLN